MELMTLQTQTYYVDILKKVFFKFHFEKLSDRLIKYSLRMVRFHGHCIMLIFLLKSINLNEK